ncbi:MAG: hypothetical protein HKP27_11110, partial [Myxococcales bacterium]|nr:hypothetical protein [Myxococcales bacterium]
MAAGVAPIGPHALAQRLILIGDAGAPDLEGEPTLRALTAVVAQYPRKSTVIFLGDNVYETGMPDETPLEGTETEAVLDQLLLNLYESRRDAEARLRAQVEATAAAQRIVFIPGNHDWGGGSDRDRIKALERHLAVLSREIRRPARLVPTGGCPGPVPLKVGAELIVLAIDTQRWLAHDSNADARPAADCPTQEPTEIARELAERLEEAAERGAHAVVVGHHPLRSLGPHGGHADWRVHLFPLRMFGTYLPALSHWIPLPAIGTAMVSVRKWRSPYSQDLSSAPYVDMRRDLRTAMSAHQPILYAAGHEHSLQLFREPLGPRYSLVSGLGSRAKASPVSR